VIATELIKAGVPVQNLGGGRETPRRGWRVDVIFGRSPTARELDVRVFGHRARLFPGDARGWGRVACAESSCTAEPGALGRDISMSQFIAHAAAATRPASGSLGVDFQKAARFPSLTTCGWRS
jgi:hypothetical protein